MTKETERLMYNEILDKARELSDHSGADYYDIWAIVSASIVFGIEMRFPVDHEHAIANIRSKLSTIRFINTEENVQ